MSYISDLDLGPGWTDANRAALTEIIRRFGRGGPEHDPAQPPAAAFDWDETVIDHDIGDALYFHQVDHLAFDFASPDFWALIPDEHRAAWHAEVAPLLGLSPMAAQAHPAYPTYRHRGYRLYYEMLRAPIVVGFPWFTQVLTGMTVAQMDALTEAVLARCLTEPLGETLVFGIDKVEPVRVRCGLRYRPAMLALLRALQDHGFQVWIVTATNRWAVSSMARRLGIPDERVIGMETALDGTGRITTRLIEPAPYHAGKATCLRAALGSSRLILAAGDSPSDEAMLQMAQAARLLIGPRNAGLLARVETARARGEPWLIQPPFTPPVGIRP